MHPRPFLSRHSPPSADETSLQIVVVVIVLVVVEVVVELPVVELPVVELPVVELLVVVETEVVVELGQFRPHDPGHNAFATSEQPPSIAAMLSQLTALFQSESLPSYSVKISCGSTSLHSKKTFCASEGQSSTKSLQHALLPIVW